MAAGTLLAAAGADVKQSIDTPKKETQTVRKQERKETYSDYARPIVIDSIIHRAYLPKEEEKQLFFLIEMAGFYANKNSRRICLVLLWIKLLMHVTYWPGL
jgi:hypothetical protein